jgi:hypothetical protein
MTLSRHSLNPSAEEQVVRLGPIFRASGRVTDAASGQPVTEFVVTPRFAQTFTVSTTVRTNFGSWYEHNRKKFTGGEFDLSYSYPLLSGSRNMHDWQFRVEADGYEPNVSRLVRDEERGLQLDFKLAPQPLPEITVPTPAGTKRVTAGAVMYPSVAQPGDTVTLFVKARVAEGHHIYALEDSGSKNLPTTLEAKPSAPGLTSDGPWRGPVPKLEDNGSRIYTGELFFRQVLLVDSSRARPGSYNVPVQLRFQVCNEALCWPPETISLETTLEVGAKK